MGPKPSRMPEPYTWAKLPKNLALHPSNRIPIPSPRLIPAAVSGSAVAPGSSLAPFSFVAPGSSTAPDFFRSQLRDRCPEALSFSGLGSFAFQSRLTTGTWSSCCAVCRPTLSASDLSLAPVSHWQGRVPPSGPLSILSHFISWAWPYSWEPFLDISFHDGNGKSPVSPGMTVSSADT